MFLVAKSWRSVAIGASVELLAGSQGPLCTWSLITRWPASTAESIVGCLIWAARVFLLESPGVSQSRDANQVDIEPWGVHGEQLVLDVLLEARAVRPTALVIGLFVIRNTT